MSVESVEYAVIILIAIASCLLHALLVRKFLASNLGKSFSQRLIVNSVFYMMLTISSILLSAFLVVFDAISGMYFAFS